MMFAQNFGRPCATMVALQRNAAYLAHRVEMCEHRCKWALRATPLHGDGGRHDCGIAGQKHHRKTWQTRRFAPTMHTSLPNMQTTWQNG